MKPLGAIFGQNQRLLFESKDPEKGNFRDFRIIVLLWDARLDATAVDALYDGLMRLEIMVWDLVRERKMGYF